jgi:hypothetical protein
MDGKVLEGMARPKSNEGLEWFHTAESWTAAEGTACCETSGLVRIIPERRMIPEVVRRKTSKTVLNLGLKGSMLAAFQRSVKQTRKRRPKFDIGKGGGYIVITNCCRAHQRRSYPATSQNLDRQGERQQGCIKNFNGIRTTISDADDQGTRAG